MFLIGYCEQPQAAGRRVGLTPLYSGVGGLMKTMLIVGIGGGNPEYITVQAVNALNRARVVFLMDQGCAKTKLNALRRDILQRYVPGNAKASTTAWGTHRAWRGNATSPARIGSSGPT
jgi:hypothetical protein